MGQLFFTDQNGRRWMCGWDNPAQGYFASRENNQPDPCNLCDAEFNPARCDVCPDAGRWQEFDVLIGFGKGVDLLTLAIELTDNGFSISEDQLDMLEDDRARQERPLTPLQQRIRGIMSELEAEGKL